MKFKIVLVFALSLVSTTALCMENQEPRTSEEFWQQQKSHVIKKIEKGDNIANINEWLHQALMKDDIPFEAILLQHGANPKSNSLPMPRSIPLVFYAQSVAALQLLEQHGADLRIQKNGGFSLLHEATDGYNTDDELFDYLLERLNPYQLTEYGGTLWHQLVACDIKTDNFIHRAKKLVALGLSPYDRGQNYFCDTVIERIKVRIDGEKKYIASKDHAPDHKAIREGLLAALEAQLAYAEQCPISAVSDQ